MVENKSKYTTAFGIPVGEDQNSLTAGERGPVLMQDVHLLEKLGHSTESVFLNGWCTPRVRARMVILRSRRT